MEKELQDAVASIIKDSGKRDALAQMIIEYANPGHIGTDFIGMFLNTRALQPGDQLVKKMRKGIKVRTLVPGSAIKISSAGANAGKPEYSATKVEGVIGYTERYDSTTGALTVKVTE